MELKIDTKRLEDKKNMLFEEESERRSPKERQKDQYEAQTSSMTILSLRASRRPGPRVHPSLLEGF